MIKKFFITLLLIILAGAGVFGVMTWRAAKGVPADDIDAKYMTSDDRIVEIAGAQVRVREQGPEDGHPVLLVHGFTHSLETWNNWTDALKSDYRVIRYDLLGHGLTGPDPLERYAPQERAAFIGDIMDALGLDSVVIAGNSLGGLAAWRFAAEQGDKVNGLILISAGAFPLNGVSDTPAEIPAAMKAYLLTAPEAGVRASAEIIYGDDSKITDGRVATMRDMIRREGNGQALIKSLEEFTLPDPAEALSSITAPTLILWGENDVIIPIEQGRRIEELIPNARLLSYPGVGHAAQEEAPEETVADAKAFLESLNQPFEESSE
ncbi:alpha/beta hydrolase [Hyphococcus flavus]|uniref:Alpha/beta hydrolase n=1 Tax=Hyphococcus flavus TaxID=1866326 RepID=A0AAE9ZEL4_9PROT|nr:alpha/beta hydrolase [Hyphococcus flavus]WDI32345.1 alpha/beta hydrolase [Hyphococcus flavus]